MKLSAFWNLSSAACLSSLGEAPQNNTSQGLQSKMSARLLEAVSLHPISHSEACVFKHLSLNQVPPSLIIKENII